MQTARMVWGRASVPYEYFVTVQFELCESVAKGGNDSVGRFIANTVRNLMQSFYAFDP